MKVRNLFRSDYDQQSSLCCALDLLRDGFKVISLKDKLPRDVVFERVFKSDDGSSCIYVDFKYGIFYRVQV